MPAASERVESGIPGLDPLIQGGYIKGSTVLVTGGTGTGKTTFCSQFLWHGIQRGEPGLYVTLEEEPEDIKKDMIQYGWNFDTYEKKGLFRLLFQSPFEVSDIASSIMNGVESIKAQRVVIDPISLVGMYIRDPATIRKKIYQLTRVLKKPKFPVTTLITSEILDEERKDRIGSLSRDGVVEFVSDAVVVLNYLGMGGGVNRSLMIRKMRRTRHEVDMYPLEITQKGMVLKKSGI